MRIITPRLEQGMADPVLAEMAHATGATESRHYAAGRGAENRRHAARRSRIGGPGATRIAGRGFRQRHAGALKPGNR